MRRIFTDVRFLFLFGIILLYVFYLFAFFMGWGETTNLLNV